jgi:hypothetical protein
VKPISTSKKALEQETDALGIIDAIDFCNEVQGFLFNRPHVLDAPSTQGELLARCETE